jgi:hypothetical protein
VIAENKHTAAAANKRKEPIVVKKPYKGLILAIEAISLSKKVGFIPKIYPVMIPTPKNNMLGINVIKSLLILIPKAINLGGV